MPTVLHVEDDVEHRIMIRAMLKKTNITLVEAADGQEALEKVQHQHLDLILLDLFLPHVDGFSVMEAVKSNPRTSHIPIIILSAWPTGDNRARAKKAGASYFVAKPYNHNKLVRLINKVLTAKSARLIEP
jgi:CheY-like chemotaxis protein